MPAVRLSFPHFSVLTERRTLISMASQTTVPNLTLSQDARLYKYVRLPSGWKYLRADYCDSFGVKPPNASGCMRGVMMTSAT